VGRYDEAVRRLNEARKARGADTAWDLLPLALVHHRLGQAALARDALAKAVRWIDQQRTAGKLTVWTKRLELELLRTEAETLIREEKNRP
jgi:hypothetical protein